MLYEDNSAKLLGLEEVIVKKVWEEETEKHIEIELPRRLHVCPGCGAETGKIYDYRMQSVKDIASFGKNVCLHLRKRRYAHSFWKWYATEIYWNKGCDIALVHRLL